jgi:uncharacterized protein
MHRTDGLLVLSPSDLVGFLTCAHLTTLERRAADGALARPSREDPELEVLFRRGLEHEEAYLAALAGDDGADGSAGEVVEIDADCRSAAELRTAEADTVAAMEAGAAVIYQATFFDEAADADHAWRGHADFLRRVDRGDGTFFYEPEDTKLARSVKPAAVLQLCHYAEQVARLQRCEPEQIHVVLGGQERVSLPLRDFAAYYRQAKRRLLEAVRGEPSETYPHPVPHCGVCCWMEACDAVRVQDDHPCLVARLTQDQTRKLDEHAGITTVADLAAAPEGLSVPGIGDAPLDRLRRQAQLQVDARTRPEQSPPYELLPPPSEEELGLAALPEPSPGDLFFDIEGDPYVGDEGLEYLFGVGWLDADGTWCYQASWAHSAAEEKSAFEAVVDLFMERWAQDPGLHIYHYADYERTALGRLMGRHATREEEVDSLLRGRVLCDLYRVVRQGMLVGTPSYSLKKLEPLYMDRREGSITDAGSSIVEYERWLETGDDAILADLGAYNNDDCHSTMLLRGWLEERRTEAQQQFGFALPRPEAGEPAASESVSDEVVEIRQLADALTGEMDGPPAADAAEEDCARWLLAQLLDWHRREAKPEWWWYFHRVLDCSLDDLVADTEAVAGLSYEGVVEPVARSLVHRYRFDPDQEMKLAPGQTVQDPEVVRTKMGGGNATGPGTLVGVDPTVGSLDLKRGASSSARHPQALIPAGPPGTAEHRRALRELATSALSHDLDGGGPFRAARDLLLRRRPRLADGREGSLRRPGEAAVDAAVRLAKDLDGGCLPIQGPPGCGKTHTAARIIVALAHAGHCVGVTGPSHKVISNLLNEVMEVADEQGVVIRALQRADGDQRCDDERVAAASNEKIERAVSDGSVDVVAGTTWLFVREQLQARLGALAVDEAGQLSLANVLAAATAARDLILVGDPQQLAQPSKGAHPPQVGVSALEHILDGHATMPDNRGLFMELTRRLHPDVCRFVSELAYEGRLHPEPFCADRRVDDGPLAGGTGLRWVPVAHRGNRTSSPEEVGMITQYHAALLGRGFSHLDGLRRLTTEDILVVAPYNAQVAQLAAALPERARVGTVDKFQGQEAPVVIISLSASSAEQIPRGIEFLYSRNRLNVAVSRAQSLAILVASPALLNVTCRTLRQLRLANGLCRFVELAHPSYSLNSPRYPH